MGNVNKTATIYRHKSVNDRKEKAVHIFLIPKLLT